MAKLKYKDKDGFWQELPVGTNVVANPMLTGTEQELTSLKVGDTKYKMPAGGGKLYKHNISIVAYSDSAKSKNGWYIYGRLYSTANAPINTVPKLNAQKVEYSVPFGAETLSAEETLGYSVRSATVWLSMPPAQYLVDEISINGVGIKGDGSNNVVGVSLSEYHCDVSDTVTEV